MKNLSQRNFSSGYPLINFVVDDNSSKQTFHHVYY